ncbi:MAG: hypothetical protein ACI4NG_05330 [Candidatus Gallimonas sp.]
MNLLSVQSRGAVWLILLFLLCVILVHGVKLARIGHRTLRKKLPPEPPKPTEEKREPVYYLVERKKKRAQSQYASPREIKFQ